MTSGCTVDAVAAAFAPHSDDAWHTLFPDREERVEWRIVCHAQGAVEARQWADRFTRAEARLWLSHQFTVTQAAAWTRHGMHPTAVACYQWRHADPDTLVGPWVAAGITDATDIVNWRREGTLPEEAAALLAAGVTRNEAVLMRLAVDAPWEDIAAAVTDLAAHGWEGWQIAAYAAQHNQTPPSGPPTGITYPRPIGRRPADRTP